MQRPSGQRVTYRSMEVLMGTLAALFAVGGCHGDAFRTLPNPGPNVTAWTFRAPPDAVRRALDCVREDARYEAASEHTPPGWIRSAHGVRSQAHVSDEGTLSSSFALQVEIDTVPEGGTRVEVQHVYQHVQNGMSCACPHGSPGRYANFETVESQGVEEARLLSLLHACLGEPPPGPAYNAPLRAPPESP